VRELSVDQIIEQNRNAWLSLSPKLRDCGERAYEIHASDRGVYPPKHQTFRAFEYFHPSDTAVVILGQDPYHTPGKANGLAFGYSNGYVGPIDSSLRNILVEMGKNPADVGPEETSLVHLAEQGVLLLNTRLTVLEGKPLSHAGFLGWETAVMTLLKNLDSLTDGIVWVGWGTEAREMLDEVEPRGPRVLTSHPCKFSNKATSAPFTGSKCFSRINRELELAGRDRINW
jgi:uracil-DNA glycosylase